MPKISRPTAKLVIKTQQPNRNGEFALVIRVQYNGRKDRSTGIWVLPKYWDDKRQCIKDRYPNSQLLNAQLRQQVQAVQDRIYELEQNPPYTLDDIFSVQEQQHTDTVEQVFEKIQRQEIFSYCTLNNYKSTFKMFFKGHQIGSTNIHLINDEYLKEWVRSMQKDGFKESTIKVKLSNVMKVVNFAYKNHIIDHKPDISGITRSLRPMFKKKAISIEQLRILRHYADTLTGKDKFYIYLYILGYYFQGMALVDLLSIKNCDLHIDNEGRLIYRTQRKKTHSKLCVVIDCKDKGFWQLFQYCCNNDSEYMIDVFKKGDSPVTVKTKTDSVGNAIRNRLTEFAEKANAGLVEGAEQVDDFPVPLSYYSIRHSFATNYIRNNGNVMHLATLMGRSPNGISTYVKEITDTDEVLAVKSVLDMPE